MIPFYYFKGGEGGGIGCSGLPKGVLVRVVLFIIMRSEDEDNLKMLREINNNTVTEIEHDLEPVPPQPQPHAHTLPE